MFLGSFVFGAVKIGTAEPIADAGAATTTTQATIDTATTTRPPSIEDVPPTTDPLIVESVRGPLTIHAVGDVALDPDYIADFRSRGYGHAFERLGGLFIDDDVTIVNLECSPSTLGSPLDKQFVFRCPPSALPVARANGIDVVNLANNHSQDFGSLAMLDGVLQARLAGLRPVGVGVDLSSATNPAIVEVGGWSIAVLGMGGVVPGESWLAAEDRPGMASGDDIEQMTAAVRDARELADLVLVTIHWGVEGETEPTPGDRDRASALIESGADAIFGHHPHRLGALEIVDGVPVYWTLGNFIWPRLSEPSATTGIARLEVSPDGEIDACLLPAFIATNGRPELTGALDCVATP